MAKTLLEVDGRTKHFAGRTPFLGGKPSLIRAVEGVNFRVGRGEVVGLVGESGSGKTTVGRLVLRLLEPTDGRVFFDGKDISGLSQREFRPYRRRMQIIFQDPFASLDPRMRVSAALAEAQQIHGLWKGEEALVALIERVGLSADHLRRYPHELSGGQRQRLVIARALAVEPEFIVADEPVSALDVSIQAQIVNLLSDLQEERQLSMLFITHDLSVVEHLSDQIIVMYLGRIMEQGATEQIFAAPRHPYTQALLAAAPIADPTAPRRPVALTGDIPSPANPPSGCVFRTRCPLAVAECANIVPPPIETEPKHFVSCILATPATMQEASAAPAASAAGLNAAGRCRITAKN